MRNDIHKRRYEKLFHCIYLQHSMVEYMVKRKACPQTQNTYMYDLYGIKIINKIIHLDINVGVVTNEIIFKSFLAN